MNTRTLRWFQQVCDGATITEVAEIEHVSQPGVSRALARLESEVGAPLLRRTGRTMRMTAAGSAFKQHVDEMLHRLDDGIAAALQVVAPETGLVRLGFQPALASWLVPALIRSFRTVHPGVKFTLVEVHDDATSDVLDSGEADLLLSTSQDGRSRSQRLRLLDQVFRLAVSRDSTLAERGRLLLSDAADQTFLMLREGTSLGRFTRAMCREAGFEPDIGFEGDDLPTLRGFVAAGLGVAILPAAGDEDRGGESGALRYLEIEGVRTTQDIGMLWSSEHRLLPSAELFRKHVADVVASGSEIRPASSHLQV